MNKISLKRHLEELKRRKPPLLVVNTVIQKKEMVLLIQRGKKPAKGTWVVPGGHVKHNEELEEAAVREAKEETGLDVKIECVIDAVSDVGVDPRSRNLVITHLCRYKSGKLKKTKDISEFLWHDISKPLPRNICLLAGPFTRAMEKTRNYLLEKQKRSR